MAKRREVEFRGEDYGFGSGIRLTVTRKGIEVFGFYDHFVGLPGPRLTWAQIEEARAEVNGVEPRKGRADAEWARQPENANG